MCGSGNRRTARDASLVVVALGKWKCASGKRKWKSASGRRKWKSASGSVVTNFSLLYLRLLTRISTWLFSNTNTSNIISSPISLIMERQRQRHPVDDRVPVAKKPSFIKSLRTKAKKALGLVTQNNSLEGRSSIATDARKDDPCSEFYSSLKEEQQIREKVRDSLECSICTDIMLDPVSLDCGHTFCLHCMAQDFARRTDGVLICCICRDGSSKAVALNRSLRDVIDSAFPGETAHRREALTPAHRQAIARLMALHKKSPVRLQIDSYWKYARYALLGLVFLGWFFYPVE
ncbi:hypothetical protein BV898_05902 [Hypsibius exemplaris]|uniref:RING-type domain-containing protein n=1 Tax=Hypsibius exemplaris TaxID=2072580 RepID=A0A1W0WY48_HYPEX|nr:hypothetical protein BV898_05902 [Hypsibius exemplaris]